MTIDFHTHCFPDSIAGKAISKLSAAAGSEPVADGTVSGLINAGKAAGISLSVVCSIATNPHQEHKVNCFAVSLNDGCRRSLPSARSIRTAKTRRMSLTTSRITT